MPEIKVESPLLSSLNNSTPKPVMKTKTSDQQEKEQAQKNVWIDKIKAIKSIKGYELKNNQITYEAEVWDKKGALWNEKVRKNAPRKNEQRPVLF